MILRGNFDLVGQQVFHGMIRAVVAEFQLEGFAAQGKPAKLVAKTDAEDGDSAHELTDILDRVGDGFGVAGTVRKKDAVGPQREDILGRSWCWNDGNLTLVIDQEAKDVLLDAIVVSDDLELAGIGACAGFAHFLVPRRNGQLDRALLPFVGPAASDASGEFLACHKRELFCLEDQLVSGAPVSRNHPAESADLTDVEHQGTRVDVPDDGNLVAIEIKLSALSGTPVGRNLGEFTDDQRFDIGMGGLFIIEIGANVSDVGIGEANNLSGIARIGENFLVTGKAGIKNNFAAPASDGAGRAAVKYAPVFERENGGSVKNFRQCILRATSFFVGLSGRQRTEVVDRPVGEDGATINILAGDGAKDTRIVGTDAVVAHHEITAPRYGERAEIRNVGVLRGHVGLGNLASIYIENTVSNLDGLSRKAHNPLDERLRAVQRIPEDDHVAAADGFEPVDEFVDEDALLVGEQWGHAGAFDLDRLVKEHDDDERKTDGDEEVTSPDLDFMAQHTVRRNKALGGRRSSRSRRGKRRALGVGAIAR